VRAILTKELILENLQGLSTGELAALCSNLSKACLKQLRTEEAFLFSKLAEYYERSLVSESGHTYADIEKLVRTDLSGRFPEANTIAIGASDRGSQRALVWGEKVTKLLLSLLGRREKLEAGQLALTNVFVCEVCGFIYIGDVVPEICPICKAPSSRISGIAKEAV